MGLLILFYKAEEPCSYTEHVGVNCFFTEIAAQLSSEVNLVCRGFRRMMSVTHSSK